MKSRNLRDNTTVIDYERDEEGNVTFRKLLKNSRRAVNKPAHAKAVGIKNNGLDSTQ